MRNKFILSILLLTCSFCIQAQNPWTIYNTVNSPLPENSVRCIAFDTSGLKWVGTDYGLASFDDVTWTIYSTSNSGLPDNYIRSIAVDRYNNKWIGTFLGGLAKFDGTNWTVYNTSNSGLPDDFVKSIAIDTAGIKWIGTIIGLAEFDDVNWTVYDLSNSVFTLSDNINDIKIDSLDVFRIGTNNGGFLKIVGGTWTLYTIPNGSGIPDNSQMEVTVDDNGVDWLATPANGLVAHPGGSSWIVYDQFTSTMPSSSATSLVTLANPDRIWIGTLDVGLIRKVGVTFVNYDPSNSDFPDTYVQCVKKDENGIIWVGTQIGGLVRLDESLLTSVAENDQLPQAIIFPQPVKDQLTVFYPNSNLKSIEVADITGKNLDLNFYQSSPDNYKINLQHLSAGIYFLRILTAENKMMTKKLIKIE